MKTMKKNLKIIFCENAGENKTLEENCMNNSEAIKFEFTSADTSQQNGTVEQKFATLYSWMCAMMVHTGLHENLKNGLWIKCVATATKLENIMVNPHTKMCT